MKHASSRELFAYWTARRGARALPERGDIEPGAIRRALGDTFILAGEAQAPHLFRLAGTRVCALFGRELKGEEFLALWSARSRASLIELMAAAAEDAAGLVAGGVGRTPDGVPQDMELLLLPLSHRGERHARMIGTLAPLGIPYWLGVNRVAELTLGTVRHLDPAFPAPAAARLVAGAEPRAPFTVYEGGRR
jgi:hypothetical protein